MGLKETLSGFFQEREEELEIKPDVKNERGNRKKEANLEIMANFFSEQGRDDVFEKLTSYPAERHTHKVFCEMAFREKAFETGDLESLEKVFNQFNEQDANYLLDIIKENNPEGYDNMVEQVEKELTLNNRLKSALEDDSTNHSLGFSFRDVVSQHSKNDSSSALSFDSIQMPENLTLGDSARSITDKLSFEQRDVIDRIINGQKVEMFDQQGKTPLTHTTKSLSSNEGYTDDFKTLKSINSNLSEKETKTVIEAIKQHNPESYKDVLEEATKHILDAAHDDRQMTKHTGDGNWFQEKLHFEILLAKSDDPDFNIASPDGKKRDVDNKNWGVIRKRGSANGARF